MLMERCAQLRDQQLAALAAKEPTGYDQPELELLQQAIVLETLVHACSTDAEVRRKLRELAARPDDVGLAARQLQRLLSE